MHDAKILFIPSLKLQCRQGKLFESPSGIISLGIPFNYLFDIMGDGFVINV